MWRLYILYLIRFELIIYCEKFNAKVYLTISNRIVKIKIASFMLEACNDICDNFVPHDDVGYDIWLINLMKSC